MGVTEVVFHDFPDQRLDSIPFIEVIKVVEAAISTYRPTVVYAHHGGDANTDHQVVFKAAYAACRPMTPIGAHVQRLPDLRDAVVDGPGAAGRRLRLQPDDLRRRGAGVGQEAEGPRLLPDRDDRR